MISPVYSFYEADNNVLKTERLRTHVEYALKILDENSRLIRYGCHLRNSFYSLLKYAIILHDFGKVPFNQVAFQVSQDVRRLSFEGHEVLSAWFADKYLNKVVNDSIIEPHDKRLIVLAVLLHHHPMNARIRAQKLLRNRNIYVDEETINAFYEELKGIITAYQVDLKSRVCAPEIFTDVYNSYGGLFPRYWGASWMNASPTDRKVFLLLIQGLIAADYGSARLTRGEGSSEFAKTIQVFLNYYGALTEK